jgi:hypothetical protein
MSLVTQITLDCLLNNSALNHIMENNEKQINKEEFKFYRKRIFNLFKDIINNNSPDELSPDVRYTYETFIKSAISYFKVIDKNDLLQEEYNELIDAFIDEDKKNENDITTKDLETNNDPNKLMMRSVKMNVNTLDKYVKRISNKKEEKIFLPKSREVDIMKPELKNKGIKKNINNIYEDKKTHKEQKNT